MPAAYSVMARMASSLVRLSLRNWRASGRNYRAAVVIGHPHTQMGGTMHTKGVYYAAKGLARIGCAVLRFNFRGAGHSEGAYDEGRGEQDDFLAALEIGRAHV